MSSTSDSTFRVGPYGPANESSFDLWIEHTVLDGNILMSVAFGESHFRSWGRFFSHFCERTGAWCTLFFVTLNALWPCRKKHPKQTYILSIYLFVHFALVALAVGGELYQCQRIFIDMRDYPGELSLTICNFWTRNLNALFPGGPLAVWLHFQGSWPNLIAYFCFAFTGWLQDGLLVRILPCSSHLGSSVHATDLALLRRLGEDLVYAHRTRFSVHYLFW